MYMVYHGGFAGPFRLEEAKEFALQWAIKHNQPVQLYKLLQTHHIKPPIVVPDTDEDPELEPVLEAANVG
jgi:hypothetical protein